MLTNCEKVSKSIAGAVLTDEKSINIVTDLSDQIEKARTLNPKLVKRLQGDLESFVMSRISQDPVYRLDLMKRLKKSEKSFAMLKLINEDGSLLESSLEVAKKLGVSDAEAVEAIGKKIARDSAFSNTYGYDKFYKRFDKNSEFGKMTSSEIDGMIAKEYKADYIRRSGESTIIQADLKETNIIMKEQGITKAKAKVIAQKNYEEGLSKFIFRGNDALQGISNLTPSNMRKVLEISSFINTYDDVKSLVNTVINEDVSNGIKLIKTSEDLKSFVVANYDNISKSDLKELYKKHIELDLNLGQRQQSYLRGELIGNIDGEVLEMRARTLNFSNEDAVKFNHPEAIKAITKTLEDGTYNAGSFKISYDVVENKVTKKVTIDISGTEQLFKVMGFDNLVRADAGFTKILKKSPALRENIFGKAIADISKIDKPQIISPAINDFFKITEDVGEDAKVFNRFFGTDPKNSRYLDISYGEFSDGTEAESKFISSFYERNSSLLGKVDSIKSIEDAITLLNNPESGVKTIILQSKTKMDAFPKEYHDRLVSPKGFGTEHNYFVRDGDLFIGSRNKTLKSSVDEIVGSVRGDFVAYQKNDKDMLDRLERLSVVEGVPADKYKSLLESYGDGDISKGYDIITSYKKAGLGRSSKIIDFGEKVGYLNSLDDATLSSMVNDALKNNGSDAVITVGPKNKKDVVEGLMSWIYPDGTPSAQGLFKAAGLTEVPTANRAILSGKLYEMLSKNGDFFTLSKIDELVTAYIKTGKIDTSMFEFTSDTFGKEVEGLFKSIKEAPTTNPKLEGQGLSITLIDNIFAGDVDMSVQLLADTKAGRELGGMMTVGVNKKLILQYKSDILEQYKSLWSKYTAEIGNSISISQPVSVQNDIREAFVVTMREFQEKIIKSDLGRFTNVNDITGLHYNVYKVTAEGELPQLTKMADDAIEKLRTKLDEAEGTISRAESTKAKFNPESIDNKLDDALGARPKSKEIDDFVSNTDTSQLSKADKLRLTTLVSNMTDLYNYYVDPLSRYYEVVNRSMVNFFQDYQLVDGIGGTRLPKKLANTIRIPSVVGQDTAILDSFTKEDILKNISESFGSTQMLKSDLEEIVNNSIIANGGDVANVALYVEDFSPYLNLSRVPDNVTELIDARNGMPKPDLSVDEMQDMAGITVQTPYGEASIEDLITRSPESKMPEVMYGNNKLQKEVIENVSEVEVFNDIKRNISDAVNYSSKSVDESVIAIDNNFLKSREDFIRQIGSKKLNFFLDMQTTLQSLGIGAGSSIDGLIGWSSIEGGIKRITRTGAQALTEKPDFSRVSKILDELMLMTDEGFDQATKGTRNLDQDSAISLARYFRDYKKNALKVFSDDPEISAIINDIHKRAFTSTDGEESALVRLKEQIEENKPFGMLNMGGTVVPGVEVKHGLFNLDKLYAEGIDVFNSKFGTNLSRNEIIEIYHSFAHSPGNGFGKWFGGQPTQWLNRFGFTRFSRVLDGLAAFGRIVQGNILGTSSQILNQSGAYLVKSYVAQKWMGLGPDEMAKLINWIQYNQLDETIGVIIPSMKGKVDALALGSKRSDIQAGDMYSATGLTPTKIDTFVKTANSILGNAGNINDALFALEIYAKHVHGALKTMQDIGYHFTSIDDFIRSQKYMTQDQIDEVIGQIKARSQRTYKSEVGNVMRNQDKMVSGFANDIYSFYSTVLSKVGRGNQIVGSTLKNIFKGGNVIAHIAFGKGGTLTSRIDDVVDAVSKDFGFQTFLLNQVGTAYLAAKFARVYDANNVNQVDEEDSYQMAIDMWKFLSFEWQGGSTSSVGRLLTDLPAPFSDDFKDKQNITGISYGSALGVQLASNLFKGVGAKYNVAKFIPKFIEGYNQGGIDGGLKESYQFLSDMSKSNLRYIYRQAVSDGGVALDSSEVGNRAQFLLGNEPYSRSQQDKASQIKLFSEWMAMTTDYARKDDNFSRYYFNSDGTEKSPLARLGQSAGYLFSKGAFWSVLNESSSSTQRGLAKVLTDNPLFKEYTKNGFIDLTSLDSDSKREYSKLVEDDLFGSQALGTYSEGDSIKSGGFYATLENFTLGKKIAIKNKSTLRFLESIPEQEIRDMMTTIGQADTTNKRLDAEKAFINKYKDNPRATQFTISALAEKEYIDTKKGIEDYYKVLNKGKGTENDVKITYAQEQMMKDAIVAKYAKPLQLSDRQYATGLLYSALIASESRKPESTLKGFVGQVKDISGNIVYDIKDKNFTKIAGELIDLERAWNAGLSNPAGATNGPLAQTMRYVASDNKIAFLKYADGLIQNDPNISVQQKIEQRVGLLNADPSLVDKSKEIKDQFGDKIWDTYVSLWFGLYKDADEVVNIYNEAMISNGVIGKTGSGSASGGGGGAHKGGSISAGRLSSPKEIKFDLPGIDFEKLQNTVTSNGFNTAGRKLFMVDDKFKISASALSKMSSEAGGYRISPLGDLNAKSNVYFKEQSGQPKLGKTNLLKKKSKIKSSKKKLLKKGK